MPSIKHRMDKLRAKAEAEAAAAAAAAEQQAASAAAGQPRHMAPPERMASSPPRVRAAYAQLNGGRAADAKEKQTRGLFGVGRELHDQLVLMPVPDSLGSQGRVNRLEVVHPSNDKVIVVGPRSPDGRPEATSVEAIYHVVDSTTRAKEAPRRTSRGYARLMQGGGAVGRSSTHAEAQQANALPPVRRTLSAGSASPAHQATLCRSVTAAQPMPSIMQTIDGNSPAPQQQAHEPSARSARQVRRASVPARPIAVPKSRLAKLQPAHRKMPQSKQLAENRISRPEYFERADTPVVSGTGYDQTSIVLDSALFNSFDLDELSDGPERRLSAYRIGKGEIEPRSPTPDGSQADCEDDRKSNATPVRTGAGSASESLTEPDFVDALEAPTTEVPEEVTGLLSGIPSPVAASSNGRAFGADKASSDGASVSTATSTSMSVVPPSSSPLSPAMSTLKDRRTQRTEAARGGATPMVPGGKDVDFYIHMLNRRSDVPAEELTPPVSPQSQTSSRKQGASPHSAMTRVPEPSSPGDQSAQVKRSPTVRPSIHRYQQDPIPQRNFWPTNPAALHDDDDDEKDGPRCFGHQGLHDSVLSRVSLKLFSRPKSTPDGAVVVNDHVSAAAAAAVHINNATANLPARQRSATADYPSGLAARDKTRVQRSASARQPEMEYLPRTARIVTPVGGQRRRHVSQASSTHSRAEQRPELITADTTPEKKSRWLFKSRWRSSWLRRAVLCKADDSVPQDRPVYNYADHEVDPQSLNSQRARSGSWAHVFHSQQQQQQQQQRLRQGQMLNSRRRRTQVRDVCEYPFRLTYNCLLWWLSPCASLGRECRTMCSTHY